MNEEEKEAIEYLKTRLYGNEGCKYIDVAQEDLRIFINLVDRKEKDIEGWKKYCEEIEEDIKVLENAIKCNEKQYEEIGVHIILQNDEQEAIEHILSDYKRVLKENEELNYKLHSKKIALDIYNRYIPKSKVEDIIDRIDYDIKKTKEIISKNTNIYASYRKNDYQIVRLRAMNTKSLDIKKRLQELLESEE